MWGLSLFVGDWLRACLFVAGLLVFGWCWIVWLLVALRVYCCFGFGVCYVDAAVLVCGYCCSV